MNDVNGVPVVRVRESATTVGVRAPGKTIGASSGVSSVAEALGPVRRTGAPRSSASAARIRTTVHGARADAPVGGAPTTSAAISPGSTRQPVSEV